MTSQSGGKTNASRVFLVDDHPFVRRGLTVLVNFEPDLEVCGEAADVIPALAGIRDLRPDIAIVDLTLKHGSGLDLISQLRDECPRVRILVVSMHDQAQWIVRALRAGAHGYVTKDESPGQLINALRETLQGKRYLSTRAAECLSAQGRHDQADRNPHLGC
jgi:DNA-binding NarL/FixJ family response regulator